ncbi:MAG: hypothetical protein HC780_18170 [Leptolyngbyaceae cyanobacterium CSU_1_3]|nr:hypothetical protein [Leptolyngbyaceae cyanobacterium CSU_1_3]
MRLSQRGVIYQSRFPTLEVTEAEILLRSQTKGWQCHTLENAYPGGLVDSEDGATQQSGKSVVQRDDRSRQVRMSDRTCHILKEVGQIHNANIQRSLRHRIQTAKDRGDYQLLEVLKSELGELVLL